MRAVLVKLWKRKFGVGFWQNETSVSHWDNKMGKIFALVEQAKKVTGRPNVLNFRDQ